MSPENVVVGVNETEVTHRLGAVEAYLDCLRAGKPVSPTLPLWNLRVLHDKSRQAGCKQICELCGRIEVQLVELQMCSNTNAVDLMAEVARISSFIRQGVPKSPSLQSVTVATNS